MWNECRDVSGRSGEFQNNDATRSRHRSHDGGEGSLGVRVGIGYDIHRLEVGRRLVLGGVEIAHSQGLEGHSDADVVLHALMDAMLGAAGLPDIGAYFPPSDDTFRDISSLVLLERVRQLV